MTAQALAPAKPDPVVKGDSFLGPAILIAVLMLGSGLASQAVGSPVAFFLLVWAPLLYKFVFASPPHVAVRVMLTLGLVLEGPAERAGNGYWTPPFDHPSLAFYGGINAWTSIPGLSLPLFSFVCLGLWLRARKLSRELGYLPPPPEALLVFKIWFGAMGLWIAWGIVRGGAVSPMFWQIVQLIAMGLCTLAFLYCVRGVQDIRAFGTIVVVAAITKGLLVAWVYFVVLGPTGKTPFYATTHSDSVTFATAFVILTLRLLEERSKPALKWLLIIGPLIIAFIIMNNRRLAFVCMGTALLTAFTVLRPDKLKRKLIIAAIAMLPVFAVYVAVGANSDHPVFALARTVSTVTSSSDSSSLTREIENYNLIVTLKESLLMGTGYGHEYEEFIKADDISAGHALYLYIPHNSVLWIVSVGGLVGFPLLWIFYPALAYFAARSYFHSQTKLVRIAALTCLGVTFILMVQSWGDMGLQSYICAVMFSAAYALAAKLCVFVDAAARQPAASPAQAPDGNRLLPSATGSARDAHV